ncbi:unnamed protein product [Dibothriocephalus latus]|uniref:Uncharacterized protein n=1 Tax=Dibothriocephalus latus TaxID=60516 RepID=A0A3P7QHZ7_DIBLA|nr:unnamed protein product [Dibothriocephalus latus]
MDSDSENVEGESNEPPRSAQNAPGPKAVPTADKEDEESLSEALSWGMMRSKWDREDNADRIGMPMHFSIFILAHELSFQVSSL